MIIIIINAIYMAQIRKKCAKSTITGWIFAGNKAEMPQLSAKSWYQLICR